MTLTTNAPTTPELLAVTLPYSAELLNGMFATALHAAKNDVTAVINAVQVGPRYFTGTDRYTVGQWEHSTEDTEGPTVLIPRPAAEWVAKQSPKLVGPHAALIVFAAESVTILDADLETLAVTRFQAVQGNFPPVGRLFTDMKLAELSAPVRISPDHMDKFTKGCKKTSTVHAPFQMQATKTDNPNKPGPVLITFAGHFTGLLQPNLNK